MFKLNEIRELIKLVDSTSIHELEIENEGSRLAIRKAGKETIMVSPPAFPQVQAVPAAPHTPASVAPSSTAPAAGDADAKQEPDRSQLHAIVAPMVGTFYQAPAPDAPPYVKKGDKVTEKTVVCIIEAMKLMNEIEAEVRGEIVDILVENGQLVEYGQPLFLVKPE